MIKKILCSFSLWCFLSLLPQNVLGAEAAIIQDEDGYTNVRKEASTKSAIIYKLLDNEVFTAFYATKGTQWIEVSYRDKQGKMSSGYVHRSRVLHLSELKEYKGKDIELSYETRAFDAEGQRIGKNENGGVATINGLPVWGTDGGLPRRETTAVNLTFKGKTITVDKSKFANLYEVNKDYTVYVKGDHYFIKQVHSDGAGGYQSVWVISQKGLQQLWIAAGE